MVLDNTLTLRKAYTHSHPAVFKGRFSKNNRGKKRGEIRRTNQNALFSSRDKSAKREIVSVVITIIIQ